MTIELTLTQQQIDAITDRVTIFNNGSGVDPISSEDFIKTVIIQPELDKILAEKISKDRLSLISLADAYLASTAAKQAQIQKILNIS